MKLSSWREENLVAPGFVADIVSDFILVIVEIADSIVDLGKREALIISDFFGVLAALEEQDDMANGGARTFDDRLATIDRGIANDIRVGSTFKRHRDRLLF